MEKFWFFAWISIFILTVWFIETNEKQPIETKITIDCSDFCEWYTSLYWQCKQDCYDMISTWK